METIKCSQKILDEIRFNTYCKYKLGDWLYPGMAKKNGKKICISVGYTLNYCIKKSNEILELDDDISFLHISKIKTGEKSACDKFYFQKPLKQYY
ncbi:MAG: hypothetical protein WBF83_02785 [Moheibacter sp.]